MQVLLIGGTGQIGCETAKELFSRGHRVTAVALSPLPKKKDLPDRIKFIEEDYTALSEEQLVSLLTGCDGLVLASGTNENFETEAPVEELLVRKDVLPLRRLMPVAQRCGVQRVVLAGSYLAYFQRVWKELALEAQPFVRSCMEQENVAMSFAGGNMAVSVLELPLVVGGGKWSVPLLLPLVADALENPKRSLVSKGGTALVTARQAAQAVSGALEQGRGGKTYPIGFYDLSWVELMRKIHQQLQLPDKKVKLAAAMTLQSRTRREQARLNGSGKIAALDPAARTALRAASAYLDKHIAVERFGVGEDDLDAALGETVKRCVEILNGISKNKSVVPPPDRPSDDKTAK